MLYQKRKFFKISYYITHPKIATPSTHSCKQMRQEFYLHKHQKRWVEILPSVMYQNCHKEMRRRKKSINNTRTYTLTSAPLFSFSKELHGMRIAYCQKDTFMSVTSILPSKTSIKCMTLLAVRKFHPNSCRPVRLYEDGGACVEGTTDTSG